MQSARIAAANSCRARAVRTNLDWGAHATRVLVLATRQNNPVSGRKFATTSRRRQHASRVRSPDNGSLFVSNPVGQKTFITDNAHVHH